MIMNSWKSIGLSACTPPLTMFIIGTGSSARRGAADIAVERQPVGGGRGLGDRERHAEDGVGAEPRLVRRAVERDHASRRSWPGPRPPCRRWRRKSRRRPRRPPSARPCRDSASCRRRAVPPPRARRSRRPTAPRRGRASRPPAATSTSTVGLPRLSRISRPMMSVMAVMAFPGVGGAFLQAANGPCHAPRTGRGRVPRRMAKTNRSSSAGRRRCPPRPRRRGSTACRTRIRTPTMSRASPARNSPALCPITGQPDFAHLVIDYVPGRWLLESKSLKLYLASFRNHGAFHEDCTVGDRQAARRPAQAEMAAHRRLLVSARRHPDRRVLADRPAAQGRLAAGPGRRALSRAGLELRRPRLHQKLRADHADHRHGDAGDRQRDRRARARSRPKP